VARPGERLNHGHPSHIRKAVAVRALTKRRVVDFMRVCGSACRLAARPVPRVLYRTTLEGDIPVGVDGAPSKAIAGEKFSGA
jgi:hypothetical protein